MRTVQTDCLILGGGLAGWTAAREAVRAGLRPALLRDGPGASPWVHGINIPVHPEDSVQTFLVDTLESGQGVGKPELAAALCGDAPEILRELEALGLVFNRDQNGYQFLQPLGASRPRVLSIGNETGVAVLKAFQAELKDRVEVYENTRAVRLSTARGRCAGALAFDRNAEEWVWFSAPATVLACGGFCGIYPFSTNKRDSGGDGPAMAYRAGAELCDMEFVQFEPSGAVWPEALRGTSMITTMFFEGAVLRNRAGERFMTGPDGERVNKDVLARRIAAEIREGRGTAHGGVYFDATAVVGERLQALYPSYVKRYRDVGIDLAREWIELAPVPHTSLGGVSVDVQCRTAVAGLFACGEVTGGLHGANRIGGSAGLETLVFGRRAGRSAAACAAQPDNAPAETGGAEESLFPSGGESILETLAHLRAELQAALATGAGVLRDGAALTGALQTLRSAQNTLAGCRGATPREAYLRERLGNDLTTAALVCQAALARADSVGCHVRTDRPEKPDSPYRITLRLSPPGDPEIRKESA